MLHRVRLRRSFSRRPHFSFGCEWRCRRVLSCLAGEGKPQRAGEEVRRLDRGAELHPEGGRFKRWGGPSSLLKLLRTLEVVTAVVLFKKKTKKNGRCFPLFRFARERPHWPTSVGPPGVAGATPLLLARPACALSRPPFPLSFSRRPRYLFLPLLVLSPPSGLSCSPLHVVSFVPALLVNNFTYPAKTGHLALCLQPQNNLLRASVLSWKKKQLSGLEASDGLERLLD